MTTAQLQTPRVGPGRVDDEQAGLLVLISVHFPDLELDHRICTWHQLIDGRAGLVVDTDVLFAADGSNLLVTGPTHEGRVDCFVISPDGTRRLAVSSANPYDPARAARAALN